MPIMSSFPASPDEQVTLANWRTAPLNRWGVVHMREIVPTAEVRRDPLRHSELRAALRPELFDVEFISSDGVRRTVDGWFGESFADGLIVLHDGVVVLERYAGHLTPTANHLLFSVTKSVAGILTGLVVDRCGLDPGARVGDLVPETAGGGFADATVRDLLDMRTSIDFDEIYDDPSGHMASYREAAGWTPPRDPSAPGDLRNFLASIGRRGRHGEGFLYLSPVTDMLGWVCERVAGRPFAELLSEWVWAPMGAWCSADLAVDRLGAPRTAGGLAASLRDMARFTEMIRCDGRADGRQIVPAAWIDDLLTGGDPRAWQAGEYATMLPPEGCYRNQFYLSDGRGSQTMGIGIHGQWIWFDRDRAVTVVKFTSRPEASNLELNEVEMAMFAALASAV